eukprot:scaffold91_cov254-Pinguiococcus_pyrenoidosus.AAC.4
MHEQDQASSAHHVLSRRGFTSQMVPRFPYLGRNARARVADAVNEGTEEGTVVAFGERVGHVCASPGVAYGGENPVQLQGACHFALLPAGLPFAPLRRRWRGSRLRSVLEILAHVRRREDGLHCSPHVLRVSGVLAETLQR